MQVPPTPQESKFVQIGQLLDAQEFQSALKAAEQVLDESFAASKSDLDPLETLLKLQNLFLKHQYKDLSQDLDIVFQNLKEKQKLIDQQGLEETRTKLAQQLHTDKSESA